MQWMLVQVQVSFFGGTAFLCFLKQSNLTKHSQGYLKCWTGKINLQYFLPPFSLGSSQCFALSVSATAWKASCRNLFVVQKISCPTIIFVASQVPAKRPQRTNTKEFFSIACETSMQVEKDEAACMGDLSGARCHAVTNLMTSDVSHYMGKSADAKIAQEKKVCLTWVLVSCV